MKKNLGNAIFDFDRVATQVYLDFFSQFSSATNVINRNKDENVFKMQVAKFAGALKYRLDQLGKKMVTDVDPKDKDRVESILLAKIQYYLQEFDIRCNAL